MASQPEAEELTTVVGGSRSSAWVGQRETLMEDKTGVAIIYKDSAKTFRLPRMHPKISAIPHCELQTVSNKNRLC